MIKRVGSVEAHSSRSKDSKITIRVHYNQDVFATVCIADYDELCDLEYLIKTIKRKMEE